MRSNLLHAIALLLFAGAPACNSSDLVAPLTGENEERPFGGISPNPHDTDGDGESDDAAPPIAVPSDFDVDGDGIPDADDLIPCMAFYMKVWNQQVTSGEIILNGQTIVPPDFFPTSEILIEFINPSPGVNTLTLGGKLAGSPEDELHIEIWDVDGTLYLHETLVRGGGKPENPSVTFEINVTC